MAPLVDTNVLGELARSKPHPAVLAWAERVKRIHLSAVTVEEVEYGLALRPRARIAAWFERFLDAHCTILPVDANVARTAGRLRGQLGARGQARTQADVLIAATAALHGLPLVTRNERDFRGTGIAVIDPWSG